MGLQVSEQLEGGGAHRLIAEEAKALFAFIQEFAGECKVAPLQFKGP